MSFKSNINQIVSDVSQAVNLPDIFNANRNTGVPNFGKVPWKNEGRDSVERAFFSPFEIKPERWNKMFPYRLVVYDVKEKKIVSELNGTVESTQTATDFGYVIEQTLLTGNWEARLPITPQQLQISDQYAINTSATMRGVVEEHNGLRFKTINVSATTGIWPRKPTNEGKVESKSNFSTIFGGTLEQLGNVASSVRSISNTFNGKPNNPTMTVIGPESGDIFSTGYYQALYIAQFLERYAEAKRDPKNASWRLVFDIPKQNQAFVVTPQAFSLQQSVHKPNQMILNMQLRAWKRINLSQQFPIVSAKPPAPELSDFQNFANTIAQTRRTLSNVVNLVKTVRSDFRRVFDVLRQTALLVKDAGGVVTNVSELPNQIVEDAKSTIIEAAKNAGTGAGQIFGGLVNMVGGASGTLLSATSYKSSTSQQKTGQMYQAIKSAYRVNEGLSQDQVMSGALGQNAINSSEASDINSIFQNPEENFDFFNSISIASLDLTPEQEDAIADSLSEIDLITVDKLREFKAELLSLSNDIANNFGAMDEDYAKIYKLLPPRNRDIDLSIEEGEILLAIFDAIEVLDQLTATRIFDDRNIQSPLQYVGGLAAANEISFQNASGKKPVPVPFGLTIEEISARYLQNPDRWLEIATLNNLRSPYIDEEGYTLNFLSNGTGRQFTVQDNDNRLYIGQKIILLSDVVPQLSAKIIDFTQIVPGQFLVSVDGDVDLSNLLAIDNARLIGYLPGTVNSQNQIYIPTNEVAKEDDGTFAIPGLEDTDRLMKLSKVDWLLTDSNDVALNALGEIRYSVGLTNLIQALKLKIQTKRQSLLRHLDYGLGLQHGISVADIDNGEIIKSFNQMIAADGRFEGIDRIQISLEGAVLRVNLSVRIASNSGVLPISFNVNAR